MYVRVRVSDFNAEYGYATGICQNTVSIHVVLGKVPTFKVLIRSIV